MPSVMKGIELCEVSALAASWRFPVAVSSPNEVAKVKPNLLLLLLNSLPPTSIMLNF